MINAGDKTSLHSVKNTQKNENLNRKKSKVGRKQNTIK